MSNKYTYQKPNEKAFLEGLIAYLKLNNKRDLVRILENVGCEIKKSSKFPSRRWGAQGAIIHFYFPIENINPNTSYFKDDLLDCCDIVIPDELGLDIMDVVFLPKLSNLTTKSLIDDLEDATSILSEEIIKEILPDDIKQKGKEMAEIYLYSYCVENTLRLFIKKIASNKFGNSYFDKLSLNKDIKNKIQSRKINESKNKWLSIRGNSELFYLDFEDLKSVIQNNWHIFKPYFPNQAWIIAKIEELADCRHLVAHNSFVENHERDLIKTYYENILKQLNHVLSDTG